MKILVVEDNPMNLELVVQLLEDDHEVATATNGEEAIAAVAKETPDLILMDVSMPVMDGLEATGRLKANAETCSIPIIAVTAHAIAAEKQRALDAGCIDVVTKPIDDEELLVAIANAKSD